MQRSAEIFISLPNILSMDKVDSSVESCLRSPTLPDVFVCLTEAKERKESSSSDDTILEALGMAEGLAEKVDLILAKLSKLDKLDEIELRLNNLSTSVSSIEMSMSQLEKEISVLDTKTKTIDKSVDELKESLRFCEDDVSDLKKNAYDIKDNCSSNTNELRKQILYLETYSRRENLKFVGIPEKSTSNDNISDADGGSSEDTATVIYKFMVDELSMAEPHKRIEFQRIHRLGKPNRNSPRPILARFLRYSDRQNVLELARSKLKGTNFAVYEDIPKELYDLRKAQMSKFKEAKRRGLKATFSKAQPDRLYINGKFIPANDPFF